VSCNQQLTNFRGYFTVGDQKLANNSNNLFPRRAILRVGMLLRDSVVAKEIRTQLLNIEERTTSEQKIISINEEQQLALNVIYAKDDSERLLAFSNYNDYKNRYIETLKSKLDLLVDGILTWDAREGINRMVRKIASKIFNNNFVKAWDKIYAEMLYKHNIQITTRKKNHGGKNVTIFDVLDGSEIKLLVKSCLSLCEMYKINVDDLFMEIN
jgi:hypothetical protein